MHLCCWQTELCISRTVHMPLYNRGYIRVSNSSHYSWSVTLFKCMQLMQSTQKCININPWLCIVAVITVTQLPIIRRLILLFDMFRGNSLIKVYLQFRHILPLPGWVRLYSLTCTVLGGVCIQRNHTMLHENSSRVAVALDGSMNADASDAGFYSFSSKRSLHHRRHHYCLV